MTGFGKVQRCVLDSGYCDTVFSFHYGPLWAVCVLRERAADMFLTGGTAAGDGSYVCLFNMLCENGVTVTMIVFV